MSGSKILQDLEHLSADFDAFQKEAERRTSEYRRKAMDVLRNAEIRDIDRDTVYVSREFKTIELALPFFDPQAYCSAVEFWDDGVPHFLFQQVTNEDGIYEMLNSLAHPDYRFVLADGDGESTSGNFCYYKLVPKDISDST